MPKVLNLKFSELLDLVGYLSTHKLKGTKNYKDRIKKYAHKVLKGKLWWATIRSSQRQLNKIYIENSIIASEYWHYIPKQHRYSQSCAKIELDRDF